MRTTYTKIGLNLIRIILTIAASPTVIKKEVPTGVKINAEYKTCSKYLFIV